MLLLVIASILEHIHLCECVFGNLLRQKQITMNYFLFTC